jgi:hypothetical protein
VDILRADRQQPGTILPGKIFGDLISTRTMERQHGDGRQDREGVSDYSSSRIDMRTNESLISADPDVGRRAMA